MSDLAAILTALGIVITAFFAGALKLWAVVKDVNGQLSTIAKEAREATEKAHKETAKAEDEAAKLRGEMALLHAETAALREEVRNLREELDARDRKLSELAILRAKNEELEDAISDLESRLIESENYTDKYKKLWQTSHEEEDN